MFNSNFTAPLKLWNDWWKVFKTKPINNLWYLNKTIQMSFLVCFHCIYLTYFSKSFKYKTTKLHQIKKTLVLPCCTLFLGWVCCGIEGVEMRVGPGGIETRTPKIQLLRPFFFLICKKKHTCMTGRYRRLDAHEHWLTPVIRRWPHLLHSHPVWKKMHQSSMKVLRWGWWVATLYLAFLCIPFCDMWWCSCSIIFRVISVYLSDEREELNRRPVMTYQ